MPIIRDIEVSLDTNEVEEIPGLICRGRMHKRLLATLPEIIADIETDNLIQPALTYDIVSVKSKNKGVIELEEGTCLHAPLLSHHLAQATEIAFGVVTIGNVIGEVMNQLFKTGKQLKAVVMEELANAYLYKLSTRLQQIVDEKAAAETLQASGTLAPGDDGFDMSEQIHVLRLAGAAGINVNLSKSLMMKPRHSLSNVIGIGRRMRKWTQIENCYRCKARNHCPHRLALEARIL